MSGSLTEPEMELLTCKWRVNSGSSSVCANAMPSEGGLHTNYVTRGASFVKQLVNEVVKVTLIIAHAESVHAHVHPAEPGSQGQTGCCAAAAAGLAHADRQGLRDLGK